MSMNICCSRPVPCLVANLRVLSNLKGIHLGGQVPNFEFLRMGFRARLQLQAKGEQDAGPMNALQKLQEDGLKVIPLQTLD